MIRALFVLLLMTTAAVASVNVESDGVKLGPAQDINIVGASVTSNGPVKTVNMDELDGDITVDGSIYVSNLYSAGNKRVVCVNALGFLYASATTVDCN